MRQLAQATVEHAAVEVLDDRLAVGTVGSLRTYRHLVKHLHLLDLHLGIGGDAEQRFGVLGDVVGDARALGIGVRQAAEAVDDALLDIVLVEIAGRDDGHQVGPVPVAVITPHRVVGEALQALFGTDRQPDRVLRPPEQNRELDLVDAGSGAEPQAPLLDDDPTLLVDLLALERHRTGPVLEDLEGSIDDDLLVGRDRQHVDGLVEARVGVDMGPEAHPERLQRVDQRLLLVALGAVERHVLDEVRDAELVVILEQGAHLYDKAQVGAARGIGVLTDEIAHPVGKLADDDRRIDRHDRIERRDLGVDRIGREGPRPLRRIGDPPGLRQGAGRGQEGGNDEERCDQRRGELLRDTKVHFKRQIGRGKNIGEEPPL